MVMSTLLASLRLVVAQFQACVSAFPYSIMQNELVGRHMPHVGQLPSSNAPYGFNVLRAGLIYPDSHHAPALSNVETGSLHILYGWLIYWFQSLANQNQ